MLSVVDTEAIIFSLVRPSNIPQDTEIIDLFNAYHRILATPIISQLDFPHWDNSAMDGFAVRYEDVKQATVDRPIILEVVEEIAAGYLPQLTITSGQAARIFTGGMIPVGADTVVMQEYTRQEENHVFILATPKPQQFIRYQGSYCKAGTPLLPAGIKLNSLDIGILAAAQCKNIRVYRKARAAILSIGDELVTTDALLQPGQIVDSNQYTLAALVTECGGEAVKLGIINDDPKAMEEIIAQAIAKVDMIISCGGVSVGDYDYVEQVLQSMGSSIQIHNVAMKPGKPLTVATFPNGKLYFGLPGNPASALVTFVRFVQPVIKKLSGLNDWQPVFLKAITNQDLRSDGKRETYIPGKLYVKNGVNEFSIASGHHNSGNFINLTQTNGLARLKVGETLVLVGQEIEVLRIGT